MKSLGQEIKSISEFIKIHSPEIIGVLFLLVVVIVNKFPTGFIILGGDVLQPINMAEQFERFHIEWFGRVSFFYWLVYLLDVTGVSDSVQLSWFLGVFLIGSYLSFLSFGYMIFPRAQRLTLALTSLFYSTNIFTLYIFTNPWGFTHYQVIYVILPALVGVLMLWLQHGKRAHLFGFMLVSFLASMCFGNPAYFLALFIFILLLIFCLAIFQQIRFNGNFIFKLVMAGAGFLIVNLYWLLPLLPQVPAGVESVLSSKEINLSERLEKTSNAIFDTIRLLPTSEQERYFPYNFPYPKINWAGSIITFLAFIPFLLVLLGFFLEKSTDAKKKYAAFLLLFSFFIVLVGRVRFPFDGINTLVFSWPGMSVLRGYDKLATFLPFILSVCLVLFLNSIEKMKYSKAILSFFFIITVILALPFYFGGIQTKLSYILYNQKSKDFSLAKHAALVKVPEEYYSVQSLFKSDRQEVKISSLPYSPGSAIGRVDLPAWKVNGPHVAFILYDKKFVEMNDYYLPGWIFGEHFNESSNPEWIVDLFGLIGIKYVFYQKDGKPKSQELMKQAKIYLESIHAFVPLRENDFFVLYEVEAGRVFPYVYTSSRDMVLKYDPETISGQIRAFRESVKEEKYSFKNKKEIFTRIENTDAQVLYLNDEFDALWQAEVALANGDRVALTRDYTVQYGNAWRLDEQSVGSEIRIYHTALPLLNIGMALSLAGLFIAVMGYVYVVRKPSSL